VHGNKLHAIGFWFIIVFDLMTVGQFDLAACHSQWIMHVLSAMWEVTKYSTYMHIQTLQPFKITSIEYEVVSLHVYSTMLVYKLLKMSCHMTAHAQCSMGSYCPV